jgi:protease IV
MSADAQTPHPPVEASENRRATWFLIGLLFGTFALFALFLGVAVFAITAGEDAAETAALADAKVGIVEILGPITDAKVAVEQLGKFHRDESIKAIVVRIDSPGGAVGPTQEIFHEINRVRKDKHVVASMGGVAASGGFYIAMACEKVLAMPGTITGSIGVITQLLNMKELAEWAKLKSVTYKSGPLKDAGNPFRENTPEDDAYFQALVDNIYGQFLADVAKARNLPVDSVKPVADGRVLTGQQALEKKLIDEFGNLRDAVLLAGKLSGVEGEPRAVYPDKDRREMIRELFEGAAQGALSQVTAQGLSPGRLMMSADPVAPRF